MVVGGPYASLSPDVVSPWTDVLVTGEAETVFVELLDDLLAGRVRVLYRGESQPVDIEKSPVPAIEQLPVDRYAAGVVQTSRGCPFSCEFCDVIVYLGRRQRHKTPEQVISEIENMHKAGFRTIFLSDDNFTANAKKARELVAALKRWNHSQSEPVLFQTQLSIDLAAPRNDALLRECVEAGIDHAFVGLETSNEEALLEVSKKQNAHRDMLESVQKIHAAGMQILAGIIVGFDSDGLRRVRPAIRFPPGRGNSDGLTDSSERSARYATVRSDEGSWPSSHRRNPLLLLRD